MRVFSHQVYSFTTTTFKVGLLACAVTLSACQSLPFGKDDSLPNGVPERSEQAYYLRAQKAIQKEQYDRAIAALSDLRTYYPVGKYSSDALLQTLYVRFEQGEYADAAASADQFIRLYPRHPQIDYAYYIRGVANMQGGFDGLLKYTNLNQAHRDTGFMRLAFNNFQALVNEFPNSPYAPDARQRMLHIYNQFSEAEMNAARFYIKRGACVAAIQRARWVFQYYPRSLHVPEATATLAHCYDKMGQTDYANEYKQLLKLNYPNLLTADNQVKLTATRTDASWLNRMTLGIMGERSTSAATTDADIPVDIATRKQQVESSFQSSHDFDKWRAKTPQRTSLSLPSKTGVRVGLALPEEDIDSVEETTLPATQSSSVNQTLPIITPDNTTVDPKPAE